MAACVIERSLPPGLPLWWGDRSVRVATPARLPSHSVRTTAVGTLNMNVVSPLIPHYITPWNYELGLC